MEQGDNLTEFIQNFQNNRGSDLRSEPLYYYNVRYAR